MTENKCTLSNEDLLQQCEQWVHKLAKSGGKDWCLQVPVNFNKDPDMLFVELINRFKANIQSSNTWVKASDRFPEIVDKKCKPRFVKVEEKRRDGSLRITKAVAYYFPEHFKTVEWEDWDDYSEEDFPYTESDEEKGVVWLRPGWYSSIECDKCEGYWSAPLNVVEWLDESSPTIANNEIIAALQKFVSRHEAGLLPDRFVYEQAKKALEG